MPDRSRPHRLLARAIAAAGRVAARSAGPRWTLAAAGWLVSLALTVAFAPHIARAIFVFFWLAVLFAAWFGGLGPAIAVALGSVVAADYFVVPPIRQMGVPALDTVVTFVIFVGASLVVSTLASALGHEQRRAGEYARELEERNEHLRRQTDALEAQTGALGAQTAAARAAAREAEGATERLAHANVALAAANHAKTQFLATMSHELRTPLNAIGGYAELIDLGLRGPVTDAQRADLARIRDSQRLLLSLINDILNFGRVEGGGVTYDLRALDVDPLLAEIGSMVAPQALARSLDYVYAPGPGPLTARADPEKLRQVVLNLLTNAVKFTPPGGRITLAATASGDGVAIRVSDTGPGIPADRRDAIFEPFVQLDRTLTNNVDGAGLGLAIARELARGMGGELRLLDGGGTGDDEGMGATFVLVLPRAG